MTPAQTDTLQYIALAAIMLGAVEIALGAVFSRSGSSQKNMSLVLIPAGAGFLLAAGVLHWVGSYAMALIVAIAVAGLGCNFGALAYVRAAKRLAGAKSQ